MTTKGNQSGVVPPPPTWPGSLSAPISVPSLSGQYPPVHHLKMVADQFDISDANLEKLKQLYGRDIVFIVDDSGSMQTAQQTLPLHSGTGIVKPSNPFGGDSTRWSELEALL